MITPAAMLRARQCEGRTKGCIDSRFAHSASNGVLHGQESHDIPRAQVRRTQIARTALVAEKGHGSLQTQRCTEWKRPEVSMSYDNPTPDEDRITFWPTDLTQLTHALTPGNSEHQLIETYGVEDVLEGGSHS